MNVFMRTVTGLSSIPVARLIRPGFGNGRRFFFSGARSLFPKIFAEKRSISSAQNSAKQRKIIPFSDLGSPDSSGTPVIRVLSGSQLKKFVKEGVLTANRVGGQKHKPCEAAGWLKEPIGKGAELKKAVLKEGIDNSHGIYVMPAREVLPLVDFSNPTAKKETYTLLTSIAGPAFNRGNSIALLFKICTKAYPTLREKLPHSCVIFPGAEQIKVSEKDQEEKIQYMCMRTGRNISFEDVKKHC